VVFLEVLFGFLEVFFGVIKHKKRQSDDWRLLKVYFFGCSFIELLLFWIKKGHLNLLLQMKTLLMKNATLMGGKIPSHFFYEMIGRTAGTLSAEKA
jgi:hypothetical protein